MWNKETDITYYFNILPENEESQGCPYEDECTHRERKEDMGSGHVHRNDEQ